MFGLYKNMSNYSLFLDDERKPFEVKWVDLPLVEWHIVRSYDDFENCIKRHGLPLRISFDHDLGKTSYQEFKRAWETDKQIKYDNITEKTGLDCAKWLTEYCLDKGLPLPEYYIHSMNPIGCDNIRSVLDSYKKVWDSRQQ